MSFKNKNVRYLLCVIDLSSKHNWVKPLKDKKGKTVLNVFVEVANESNHTPNKLWIDQGRFCTKNLCKNGWTITIFKGTPHIMKEGQ